MKYDAITGFAGRGWRCRKHEEILARRFDVLTSGGNLAPDTCGRLTRFHFSLLISFFILFRCFRRCDLSPGQHFKAIAADAA